MATKQHIDPFAPGGPVSQTMLRHYAEGTLPAVEQHAVERQLESDPLLRDALEGLQQPGAVHAAADMKFPGNGAPPAWPAKVFGVSIVLLVVAFSIWILRLPEPPPEELRALVGGEQPQRSPTLRSTDSVLEVVHAELDALPEAKVPALVKGPERFQGRDTAQPVIRETVERLASDPVIVDRDGSFEPPVPKAAVRSSRRLVFLHDLKLVHPQELYASKTPVLYALGVPASADHSTTTKTDPADPRQLIVPYLEYMDKALGAFVRGDERKALDDLFILLGQYPDDVNAQFYAGLCCYKLGLDERAQELFGRAERNSMDSFREEAAWYGALTTRRTPGAQAAEPMFRAIADGKGFYAAQAGTELQR